MKKIHGEWELESNKKVFNYRGYRCSIVKHPETKHLCGYVKLPKRISINELDFIDNLIVHGGITFTDVESNVIGFDCAHLCDLTPSMLEIFGYNNFNTGTTYKNSKFVRKELELLVKQLIGKFKNK